MKQLLACLAVCTAIFASAQSSSDSIYFNPDINGDYAIGATDLTTLLALYGLSFSPFALSSVNESIAVIEITEDYSIVTAPLAPIVVVSTPFECGGQNTANGTGCYGAIQLPAEAPNGFRITLINPQSEAYLICAESDCVQEPNQITNYSHVLVQKHALELIHYSGEWFPLDDGLIGDD